MKSILSIKIVCLLFFVALTAPTNTAKAQTACSGINIVAACSHIVCSYTGVSNNVYTPYLFVHEDGTPGTTFKTNEIIYHYAAQNTFSCVSPTHPSPYTTVNLPTGATAICGPTGVTSYFACVTDPSNGNLVKSRKLCQVIGPVRYISGKVTQFKFTTAGTYNMTFNNGNGSTVTLTIDDNATDLTRYATITSDVGTTIAPNTPVTYTLSTNLTYTALTWRKNGITVQTGGITYTPSTLAHNDQVTCDVTYNCDGDLNKSPMRSNTVTMTVNSVMPVELKSFNGKAMKDGNLLTWNTASETNNKGFALERQLPNSKEWEDIMLFVGKNKSSTYQYLDETAPYLCYYRLRQIDADGSITYSKIISVERSGPLKGFGLSIYPNPVSEILTIEADDTNADYQVINLLGQQVLHGKAPFGGWGLNVSALPQGTYFLKVGTEQVKFIKQ